MFTSFSALRAQVQDHHDQVVADARRFRRRTHSEPAVARQPERPVLRLLSARG